MHPMPFVTGNGGRKRRKHTFFVVFSKNKIHETLELTIDDDDSLARQHKGTSLMVEQNTPAEGKKSNEAITEGEATVRH